MLLTYAYCDWDPVRASELGQRYARAYRTSAIDHYGLADGEADLARFAEVQLWGTPAQCVEKARAIAETSGTARLVVAFRFAGVPYDLAEQSMRLFAAEVAPHLQEVRP